MVAVKQDYHFYSVVTISLIPRPLLFSLGMRLGDVECDCVCSLGFELMAC